MAKKQIVNITMRIESLELIDSLISSFENVTIDEMEDELMFELEKNVQGALEFYSNI